VQAEEKPGFTGALLNILEQEQDNGVRLSSKQTTIFIRACGRRVRELTRLL
jgi:hypothetical protein